MKPGPEAGAVPMGTGIVSVVLLSDGQVALSRILLALTIAVWIALVVLTALRLRRDRAALRRAYAHLQRSPLSPPPLCSARDS